MYNDVLELIKSLFTVMEDMGEFLIQSVKVIYGVYTAVSQKSLMTSYRSGWLLGSDTP